ncbi:MAG TPA: pitrilysin family protein [Gaiellales bacterium]|jgi:predicted Zn-dependent peptidase
MFTKTELPNGLRVITNPMTGAKSVAVMVMLAAGSRYETKPTSGIAHFAEHMFFKGTEKRPTAKDISAEVDGIGGEFNAFTGKEYTGYYIKCAAEHRRLALDVLSDQLLASRFDPDEIEREKGVIIEELNMYVDTPRDHVDDVYETLLYGDQPLGWHIIGRKETIRAATRDTFLGYLDAWYTPRRMVVGAAGAVDGDFAAEVSEKFGHLEDRASGDMAPVEFVQTEPRVMLETRDSDQAHLRLGVRGLETRSPDRYAMQVLTTVLGGGMSSRLFIEVRERLGLAYYVYGYHQSYADTGTLFAQAGVDVERIDQAVGTIAGEFRKLVADPVPADELRRCKNYLKGRMVLQLEDPKGLLMFGLRREVLEDKVAEIDEVLEGIERVTAEDIQRVARQVVVDDGLNLAIVGPFDDQQRFLDVIAA